MFDARQARALAPGDHLTIPDAPGLRLVATASRRAWVYRYRSPVDDRMRQLKLGLWPAMGFPAALAAWERVKAQRDAGSDPAAEKRATRRQQAAQARETGFTVRQACADYLEAYAAAVTPKTYAEAARLLTGELDAIAARPAASITRADAFDLLDGMRDRPVIAQRVRQLDVGVAGGQIDGVPAFALGQHLAQLGCQALRQHHGAVFVALAGAHGDAAGGEVDILHAQAQALEQAHAGAVQQAQHQAAARGLRDLQPEAGDLVAGEDDRQALGLLGAHDVVDPGQLDLQGGSVQEQQRGQGLALGAGADVALGGQVAEELADLGGAHVDRVALA
jgi:hypothetical protein